VAFKEMTVLLKFILLKMVIKHPVCSVWSS